MEAIADSYRSMVNIMGLVIIALLIVIFVFITGKLVSVNSVELGQQFILVDGQKSYTCQIGNSQEGGYMIYCLKGER